MHETWHRMSPREQRMVAIAAAVVLGAIAWIALWAPMNADIVRLTRDVPRMEELAATARAQVRTCVDDGLGIKLTAPFGWRLERHSPYARIPCTLTHPDGARLTLAVQLVDRGVKLEVFAEDNRRTLRRLGMQVELPVPRAPGLEIAVTSKDRKKKLLQHYVLSGEFGYVLTLTAPAAEIGRGNLAPARSGGPHARKRPRTSGVGTMQVSRLPNHPYR